MNHYKHDDSVIKLALNHLTVGKQFYEAYNVLMNEFDGLTTSWRTQIQRPAYHCAGLAIEHFFKSYLVLQKIEFKENSQGHDLVALLDLGESCIKEFFQLSDDDLYQISLLNNRYFSHESYGKHDLRYGFNVGTRISPHPDNLYNILRVLYEVLNNHIKMSLQKTNSSIH